jgi:hypothetical protein
MRLARHKSRLTPVDLYRTARACAWRVEVFQHYDVPGDEERQRAFVAGQPLPPPRQSKRDDLELIAGLTRRGLEMGRVHVVDRPLSPYVRYELAVYAENVTAGEDVRIADRSAHPELAALARDFVIVDPGSKHPGAILFDITPDGRVAGYRVDCSRKTVVACREELALALACAVPLGEFVAASMDPRGR